MNNKLPYIAILLGSWFVVGMASHLLRMTFAFEVSIDGELVYSKLETGKHFEAHDLKELLTALGSNFDEKM